MKYCLLIGLIALMSSCATTKKQACPVVYNATIEERDEETTINEALGVILISPESIHIGDSVYNVMFKEGPTTYYCVNTRTMRRAVIHTFDSDSYKIVSVYSRDMNKYYILYPEKDYPFKEPHNVSINNGPVTSSVSSSRP